MERRVKPRPTSALPRQGLAGERKREAGKMAAKMPALIGGCCCLRDDALAILVACPRAGRASVGSSHVAGSETVITTYGLHLVRLNPFAEGSPEMLLTATTIALFCESLHILNRTYRSIADPKEGGEALGRDLIHPPTGLARRARAPLGTLDSRHLPSSRRSGRR